MSVAQSIITSLVQSTRQIDPALADTLIEMARELERIGVLVDPAPTIQKKVKELVSAPPSPIQGLTYSLTQTNILISWTPISISTLYEVRKGNTWETSDRVTITGNPNIILDPIAVGTHRYLVKSLTFDGVYSLTASSIDVIIPPIGVFSLTVEVINNFVTLIWTNPTSTFRIEHFEITRNGVSLASDVKGLFYVHQEAQAGTITIAVTAVDIVGNTSAATEFTVDVSGPTDFVIQDTLPSQFNGTFVNSKMYGNRIYFNVNTTETYQQHFTSRAWASYQDQLNAGYPLIIQPTELTGSYEEVFDFGAIYTNTIVNTSWLFETIAGNFTFGLDVSVSDDGIVYGPIFHIASFFAVSVRYVKVKFNITSGDDKGVIALYNFLVNLFVKREDDGGTADVFAVDVAGTVVSFNKSFKFVEDINVTPLTALDRSVTFNFAGGTNPTQFTVKLYDNTGIRVDGTIGWSARGIL